MGGEGIAVLGWARHRDIDPRSKRERERERERENGWVHCVLASIRGGQHCWTQVANCSAAAITCICVCVT